MRLIGALLAGVCVFLAIGIAMGQVPRLRFGLGSRRSKAEINDHQLWLRQAGLDVTPSQYGFGVFLLGAAAFAVTTAITTTPSVAIAPALAAAGIPHMYFGKRRNKNLTGTAKAWPDAIRELVASLDSNASLHGALVELASNGPEDLRPAFERFPLHAAAAGTVPALEAVRERLGDPTSDRVIEVLILAHERGGGIVTDILRDLAISTTDDVQLQEDIHTAQLEQKINGRAVFVIPWLLLILLVLTNDNFRSFYASGWGYFVVIVGAILSVVGMVLLNYLSRERPEPRVFGGSAFSDPHFDDGEDDGFDDGDGSGGGGGGGGFDDDGDGDPPPVRGQIIRRSPPITMPQEEPKLIPVVPHSPTKETTWTLPKGGKP